MSGFTPTYPLPVALGGWGDGGAAWTAGSSPVVAPSAGTITSYTSSIRTKTVGKTVFFQLTVSITNNGTGSGELYVTMPYTPASGFPFIGINRTSGALLDGVQAAGSATLVILKYDGTYPVATGQTINVAGVLEIS